MRVLGFTLQQIFKKSLEKLCLNLYNVFQPNVIRNSFSLATLFQVFLTLCILKLRNTNYFRIPKSTLNMATHNINS